MTDSAASGDNVLPFRQQPPMIDDGEMARCECGEAWFVLVGQAVAPNGAVTVTHDGRVTGYHGELRCLSCGAPGPRPPEVLTYG